MAKLRERVDRYRPARVSANVATAVRGVGDDVRASVADGVDTMRATRGRHPRRPRPLAQPTAPCERQ